MLNSHYLVITNLTLGTVRESDDTLGKLSPEKKTFLLNARVNQSFVPLTGIFPIFLDSKEIGPVPRFPMPISGHPDRTTRQTSSSEREARNNHVRMAIISQSPH